MENTLNSRKKGTCYHRRQKISFYFSLAEPFQGRWGNPLAKVALPAL